MLDSILVRTQSYSYIPIEEIFTTCNGCYLSVTGFLWIFEQHHLIHGNVFILYTELNGGKNMRIWTPRGKGGGGTILIYASKEVYN